MNSSPVDTSAYRVEWHDQIPTVYTERLTMRIPDAEDAPEIARFYRENLHHLMPWYPDALLERQHADYWVSSTEERKRRVRADEGYGFHLFQTGSPQVVGFVTVAPITRYDVQYAQIGYGLDERFQGRGLMLEAVRAAVRFAFDELDLHRLEGCYDPNNERSGKVLHACGFEREGLMRGSMRIGGEWRDHVLTAILNPNWKGRGRRDPSSLTLS